MDRLPSILRMLSVPIISSPLSWNRHTPAAGGLAGGYPCHTCCPYAPGKEPAERRSLDAPVPANEDPDGQPARRTASQLLFRPSAASADPPGEYPAKAVHRQFFRQRLERLLYGLHS